jgi:N-acetyl sugar amidotransferase
MILIRCTKCVMPTTRPDTAFADGVCSACAAYEARKEIDWDARERDLIRILESSQSNQDGYTAVLPSSGQKDSLWQVRKVIELGFRPLIVTASTCMLTAIGAENIRNLARFATTIEVTPNLRVRSILNRLGLELVGDISFCEHVSINCTPFKVAAALGIKTIIYGECPNREYGGPPGTEDTVRMTSRWISEFGGQLRMRPSDLVGQDGITELDMADYTLPSEEVMDSLNAIFLGQYYPWDSHRNARVAVTSGMKVQRPTPHSHWDFENLDNAQTGIHDHFKYLKFGFGRVCDQVSVDIRYGLLTREEGYEIVREHDGQFPYEYMGVSYEEVLDKIGITVDDFKRIVHIHTNRDLFGRIDEDGLRPVLKEFC